MKPFNFFVSTCLIFLTSYCCFASEQKIPQRYIKKLNRQVSFLGLGTVELGRDWGIDTTSVHPSEKIAEKILKTALNSGMQVIDTASSYQLSEERIGHYVSPREQHYLLITKAGEHSLLASDSRCKLPAYDKIYCHQPGAVYDFSQAAIFKDVEASLNKLKVKRLDVVLLHLDSHTAYEVMRKGEALGALLALKKQGKVSFIGISMNGKVAKETVLKYPIDVIELEYNLLNQSNQETIDLAHAKGIGVIVRGGLGTGLLTSYVAKHIDDPNLPFGKQVRALVELTHGNYQKLTELALAFLYQNPHISTVIIGADQPTFIKQDMTYLNQFHDQALLEQAKKILASYETPPYFTEIMGEHYQ